MVQHVTFMTFLLLDQPRSQGAFWDPQGTPRTLQRHLKDPGRLPHGPPRDPRGPSRTSKAGNLRKFYVELADCHQIIPKILLFMVWCWGHISLYICIYIKIGFPLMIPYLTIKPFPSRSGFCMQPCLQSIDMLQRRFRSLHCVLCTVSSLCYAIFVVCVMCSF